MVREPLLTDAFFQLNLEDGFGFLDVRGALVHHFRSEFQGLAELTSGNAFPMLLFRDPVDPEHPIIEFKIGVDQIWVHLRGGVRGVSIRQECSRIVEAACSLMSVTRFSRQGLRTQYVFGTDTVEDARDAIFDAGVVSGQPWRDLGEVQHVGAQFIVGSGRVKAIIRLSPARKVRTETSADASDQTTPVHPPIGVMFDIDAFDDRQSDTRDPRPHLNRAMKYIEDEALPFVAHLLRQGQKR